MQRTPEPDLMDDDEQARAYARADFSEPHNVFIEQFAGFFPAAELETVVLDLGCGAADISIRFARAWPRCRLHGVDGAAAMLNYGRQAVNSEGLQDRIELLHGYLPGIQLPRSHYDVIISNSLLHHLQDPMVMWQSLTEFGRSGTQVFIMDLMRPKDEETAAGFVEQYAGEEAAILKQDFYHSLLAAYEVEEVHKQLREAGLAHMQIRVISDRHFCVHGIL